jgi:hypothetical protein
MFGSVFAIGKYDYDATWIESSYQKTLSDYKKIPSSCNPSSADIELSMVLWWTTGWLASDCEKTKAWNAKQLAFYTFSGDSNAKQKIHKYVSDFQKKYRWKKDIPTAAVDGLLKFSIDNFKYGCYYVMFSSTFGLDLINEYNANLYWYTYNIYGNGEYSFVYNNPKFPVLDDISRVHWWLSRLCRQPEDSIQFIKNDAKEMSIGWYWVGRTTDEDKAEILSTALSRWYIPFEERYAANPMFWTISSINNNSQISPTITQQKTCSSNQHLENKKCVSNKKSCAISKGRWQKVWSGSVWGSCNVIKCNSGYQISGNMCSLNMETLNSSWWLTDAQLKEKIKAIIEIRKKQQQLTWYMWIPEDVIKLKAEEMRNAAQ